MNALDIVIKVVFCASVFLGGTAIYQPDALPQLFGLASQPVKRMPIAQVVALTQTKLLTANPDGDRPAMTEEELATFDAVTQ